MLELVEDGAVALGARYHDDVIVILRTRAQQGDAADVDLLEKHRPALTGGRAFSERVEIDDDHVDRLDALARELVRVGWIIAPSEQRGVDLGVQRLHPTAEQRWLAGHVFDGTRADPVRGELGARPIGGDQFPTEAT